MMNKKVSLLIGILFIISVLAGCIDQTQGRAYENQSDLSENQIDNITNSENSNGTDDPGVETACKKVAALGREPRIVATSPSVVDICDKLDIELVGICSTESELPSRYENAVSVGSAMNPDMEIISSLEPDWILSPASLQSDLQPKYETIHTDWAFLNMKSVAGMYRSIEELGEIFGRETQANQLVNEYQQFYEKYQNKNAGRQHPKVLILMGFPGSYIIATENSYVGSLVAMAGGENVYAGSDQEFLNVNTEDMKQKEPDIILRTAHAMPDQVADMFNEEFQENDIWQHFSAVQNDRVYDLTQGNFGMSANFDYPQALAELQEIFYPETEKTE